MGFKEISVSFNEKIFKIWNRKVKCHYLHLFLFFIEFIIFSLFFNIYVTMLSLMNIFLRVGIIFTIYMTAFEGWSELCHL